MSIASGYKYFLTTYYQFVGKEIDKVSFKKYLLGKIWQDKYFSVHGISKNTNERVCGSFIFSCVKDTLEKSILSTGKVNLTNIQSLNFYITADGTPLNNNMQRNRITKRGFVSIIGDEKYSQK